MTRSFMQLALILMGCGMAMAFDTRAQEVLNKVVTINVEGREVRSVLSQLEKQADVRFVYSSNIVDTRRKVSIHLTNEKLSSALERILKPLQISYDVAGTRILLHPQQLKQASIAEIQPLLSASLSSAPLIVETPVRGRVVDENGATLPGVSVVVKGTARGSITDADGNYTIAVPDGKNVLIFSSVGFLAQEVQIGGRTTINLTMATDVRTLSEVVAIGYGTQKRTDLTGAVSQVSGEELRKVPVTGIDQALQGRVAGVNVTSTNGEPGRPVEVRIRGFSSLNNNDPLYVVDGVPTKDAISSLNPNDIETIDILKDASATAIYGVQAANGVVVITTKRGGEGKAKVTFDAYQGVQRVWRTIPVLGPRDMAMINNERINNGANAEQKVQYTNPAWANPNSLPEVGTDWQDAIFRPARLADYSLGVRGGSKATNYGLSAGYRDQQGIIINSGYKRYTFAANLSHQISNRISVGSSFNYAYSIQNGINTNQEFDGTLINAIQMPSDIPVYNADGTPGEQPRGEYVTNRWGMNWNPVVKANYTDRATNMTVLFGNIYADVKILNGLSFRSTLGGVKVDGGYKVFNRKFLGVVRSTPNNGLFQGTFNSFQYNWDQVLTYDRTFGGTHTVKLTAGYSAQNNNRDGISVSQQDFDNESEGSRYLGQGNPALVAGNGYATSNSLIGAFARAFYSYKDRYLLTATVRRDGASDFEADKRFRNFPAISVGWRVSQEPFMKDITAISDLKIRASWGKTGNRDAAGAYYPTSSLLVPNANYAFGGTYAIGLSPRNSPNKDLIWETTTQQDLGIEASFLNNALQLTADYYTRETNDMILQAQVPAVSGFGPPIVNLGGMRNSGIELGLSYRGRLGNGLNYNVSANGATLKNEVTSLGGVLITAPEFERYKVADQADVITRAIVGKPISTFYGYIVDGIFQNTEEIKAHSKDGKLIQDKAVPGDIRFRDLNGDGKLDAADKTDIGSPIPTFTYGFNLSLDFKGFDFSAFLQGVAGNKIYNAFNYYALRGGQQAGNYPASILGRWYGEGTSTTQPRVPFIDNNDNGRVSTRWVEDGAYTRLRSMQLGYTLPRTLLSKASIDRIRVYVSAQNLFTITKYTGFDPEQSTNGGRNGSEGVDGATRNLQIGVDRGVYPQPRTFMVGVQAAF